MRLLWCWRCRMELPMLDETEWEEVSQIHRESLGRVKAYRRAEGVALGDIPDDVRAHIFAPLLDAFERLTGYRETNPSAIWHHRLSLYGPPCSECGKPLRTPRAKLCAACGAAVEFSPGDLGRGTS